MTKYRHILEFHEKKVDDGFFYVTGENGDATLPGTAEDWLPPKPILKFNNNPNLSFPLQDALDAIKQVGFYKLLRVGRSAEPAII